jgi:hypothetical protein
MGIGSFVVVLHFAHEQIRGARGGQMQMQKFSPDPHPAGDSLRSGSAVESLPAMRTFLFLLLPLWSAAALAQTPTMYKCTDSQKRITYSNEACEKQGLKEAGQVADRVTTMPLGPVPKPAPAGAAKAPGAKDGKDAKGAKGSKDDTETIQRGAQMKPVVPLLEKLSK